jgi:hypothetical protein
MKRYLLLVVGAIAFGCTAATSGHGVALLTGVDAHGCYSGGEGHAENQLVAGGDYGTMFDGKPVMWPVGYTGRWVGSEVEVINDKGEVVATTGRRYSFGFGPISDLDAKATQARLGAFPVGANCGGDLKELASPSPS